MMNMYYKWKGRNALRGNWQTAMVVAFFSGIFLVLTQVYQNRFMPVAIEMIDGMYYWRVPQITRGVWIGFAVLQLCSVLLTPVLSVGCNHYFVRRIEGEELGAKGLFSRMNLTGKALWLYVMMFVKIFLWTCLLIVPGFIAAIRYSMASYLLAEHPEMTAKEALEESKRARGATAQRIHMLGEGASILAQMGVFILGAYLAVTGQGVTPGVVILFVQLMNFVLSPVTELPPLLASRKAALALMDEARRQTGLRFPADEA